MKTVKKITMVDQSLSIMSVFHTVFNASTFIPQYRIQVMILKWQTSAHCSNWLADPTNDSIVSPAVPVG